jgi:hypothetical protein
MVLLHIRFGPELGTNSWQILRLCLHGSL